MPLPTLNELAASRRLAPLRRLAERLGPFSPFATIETFSPASRLLLADAERDIERILHVVRLVVVFGAFAIAFLGFGMMELPSGFRVLAAVFGVGFAALWLGVWIHLGRRQPSMGLRCALILFDGYLISRGIIFFQDPGGVFELLAPDLYRALSHLISRADVEAITPPMLVYLALSGSFRLDPRLAAFSTAVALAVFGYLRVVFPAPVNQTWVVALIIWFSGALGANAARVIRYVALKASQERLLERYVPSALTQEILRSGDPDRTPRVEEVTVLVADIRGFTRLSESLGPGGAVALLNECFGVLLGELAAEGAVLDKYVGDGLLVFFEGADHAARALRTGRRMLAALAAHDRSVPDRTPLRIGVAIHTGEALLGTIGAGSRRDYTLIGDVVNVATRLEDLNKRFGSSLIVSATALHAAPPGPATAGLSGPTTVELRGRAAAVQVHYLIDAALPISARTRT